MSLQSRDAPSCRPSSRPSSALPSTMTRSAFCSSRAAISPLSRFSTCWRQKATTDDPLAFVRSLPCVLRVCALSRTSTANYASALSLELLRGPAPEFRDFVRLKFKNGTDDEAFQTLHMFGHPEAEVPVTEFIYRLEVRHAVGSMRGNAGADMDLAHRSTTRSRPTSGPRRARRAGSRLALTRRRSRVAAMPRRSGSRSWR